MQQGYDHDGDDNDDDSDGDDGGDDDGDGMRIYVEVKCSSRVHRPATGYDDDSDTNGDDGKNKEYKNDKKMKKRRWIVVGGQCTHPQQVSDCTKNKSLLPTLKYNRFYVCHQK